MNSNQELPKESGQESSEVTVETMFEHITRARQAIRAWELLLNTQADRFDDAARRDARDALKNLDDAYNAFLINHFPPRKEGVDSPETTS